MYHKSDPGHMFTWQFMSKSDCQNRPHLGNHVFSTTINTCHKVQIVSLDNKKSNVVCSIILCELRKELLLLYNTKNWCLNRKYFINSKWAPKYLVRNSFFALFLGHRCYFDSGYNNKHILSTRITFWHRPSNRILVKLLFYIFNWYFSNNSCCNCTFWNFKGMCISKTEITPLLPLFLPFLLQEEYYSFLINRILGLIPSILFLVASIFGTVWVSLAFLALLPISGGLNPQKRSIPYIPFF